MRKRAVTISRQSGSGGHAVGEALAAYLQAHAEQEERPWTVFDRELVKKVIEDHHLPERLERFLTEDRISEISDTLDELFGLHPPSSLLVRKVSETILRLVELGNVILVGRGGGLITRNLDYVLHVRLVGSLAKRVEHMQVLNGWSAKQAREFVEREDLGRKRYLKKYFSMDIDDPLLYHLVINTDIVPYEDAARLIGEAVLAGRREVSHVPA
jgi:cytidylate kinase